MDRRLAVHRTIVIVDVEGFGDQRRTNRQQVEVRDVLYQAMREAFGDAGIPWDGCDHEDRGDGIFILVPAEVPKSLLVESLPPPLISALHRHNGERSGQQSIRLRLALHAGEVHYDDHGVTGAAINLAFRLLDARDLKAALAHSPGVLAIIVSPWFFEEVVRHGTAADAYSPVLVAVKETTVTGWMCVPDRAYPACQGRPGTSMSIVRASAALPEPALRTLPRDVAAFTGRARELEHLVAAVSQAGGNEKLISVHAVNGMAGVGKTAFAVHAAHRLSALFPDGQIFLRLHAHTPGHRAVDPAEALGTLLLTTGVAPWHIPQGLDARSAAWRGHLAGKRMLLVFDDAAGTDQVRPLLPGSPGCLVLVTSRRRLTALDALPISLDMLPPGEAAGLFVRSAARTGLRADESAVAEMVRLCGCLPLAIRLVAARLGHHPALEVGDLASEMASARDRLTAMQAEDISVAAAFDLSYQDLTTDQQRTFRRLGLHPGADIHAHAAAALNNTEVAQARRDIEALYDQHLLTELTYDRYRMHDLIREHARSLAAVDPPAERDAALDRLLEYYLRSVRVAGSYLARRIPARPALAMPTPPGCIPDPPAREEAVAWMDAERHNLLAAVRYAARHGRPRYAAAIAAEMHDFLRVHGDWDTALSLHQTAADAAHLARGRSAEPEDQRAEAGSLADFGDMQYLSGSFRAANASLRRAAELYRDLDDRLGKANVLSTLGRTQEMIGDTRGAAASYEQALDLYRGLRSVLGEATTLNRLGGLQALTDPYPAAASSQEQALVLYRSLGDPLGEAYALSSLGLIQSFTGDLRAGAASLARALQLHRDLGNLLGEVNALTSVGTLQTTMGDYEAASATLAQSLQLEHRLRSRLGEARVRHQLGVLQSRMADHQAASASLTRALELYRDLDYPLGEAQVLNTIGELLLQTASPSNARAHHDKAWTIATALQCLPEEARALEGIGRCHLRDRRSCDAAKSLHQALTIYKKIGSSAAGRVQRILDDHGI